MSLVWAGFAAVLFVSLLYVAITYYRRRSHGKSYFAVSATSAMGAVWASYAALLGINWPAVIVAILLRSDGEKVLQATQPNALTIFGGLPVASLVTFLIYRLAAAELHAEKLPLNASAREIEEPGKDPGLVELTGAHVRYRLGGRIDEPLGNPGEDPYKLPELPRKVDWAELAADLLVQIEPNLQLDTYRPLDERAFFELQEIDVRIPNTSRRWIVKPIHNVMPINESLETFDKLLKLVPLGDCKLILCIDSEDHRDETLKTKQGLDVRVLSLGAMIEKTLDLHEYAASLVRRFEQRFVPGTSFTLKDSFVDIRAAAITPRDRLAHSGEPPPSESVLGTLAQWAGEPGVDHISLIGEFGQGKSTALLAFCTEWAKRWLEGNRGGRIPLLIELRGKSPRRQSQDRFLAEWGDRYGLRGSALLSLVRSGRAILIFEGFDEVQDAGLRYDRFEQFKSLWSFSYPGSKLVFTGRPNFFLDTHERERLLRSSAVARDAGLENTRILSLLFLEERDISRALRAYPRKIRVEIIEACRGDEAFKDIAKRPSMLPVIANQWPKIKEELKQGGVTSASIIKYFIEFLYARKEADTDKHGEYQLLHRSVRHYFTQRIAWTMAKRDLRNTIDVDTFARVIDEAYADLDSEFRLISDEDAVIASSIYRLKEMFKGRPHSELISYITSDVRTNGLLVPDPAGGRDNLYFPHKQYLEFVVAEVYVSGIRNETNPHSWVSRLQKTVLLNGVLHEPVSLFFASGLLTTEELQSYQPSLSERIKFQLLAISARMVLIVRQFPPSVRLSMPRYKALGFLPNVYKALLYMKRRQDESHQKVILLFTATLGVMTILAFVLALWRDLELSPQAFNGTSLQSSRVLLTFLPAFTATTMMFPMFLIIASRAGSFTVWTSFLVMEAYRCGAVRRVSRFGVKEHAACICMLQWSLPIGAVNIPLSTLEAAYQTMEFNPMTVGMDGSVDPLDGRDSPGAARDAP